MRILVSGPVSCLVCEDADILLKESISDEMTCTDSEGVSGREDNEENGTTFAGSETASGWEVREYSKDSEWS